MNVLNITDGTTVVNLLNLADGFSVDDWRQKIAQYKGGGTWHQSALTDESRLVAKAFDNVVEEIPMPVIKGAEADIAAAGLAILLMLLEKASDYWQDDWRNEPVWVESQNDCETNRQYAIVYAGGFPDLGDPYSHEYLTTAVLTDLVLRLVRGHWADNQPMVGTALPISARETFDSRWFGNVDDTGAREVKTTPEVYTVNKRTEANITHAYRVTNAGVWTDLIAAGPPVALLPPAGHVIGDFLLVGIWDFGVLDLLFSNVIFDISTTNTDLETVWEYWDGAAPWGQLLAENVIDNTDTVPAVALDAFTVAGVNGVWWTQPDDWVKADLNADIFGGAAPNVDGYWVRCRVTNVGGAPVSPIQQNRDIYTCTWPYIEVQAADVGGHINAISKILAECRSDNGVAGTQDRHVGRIIGGLRTVSRGPTFVSMLNFAISAIEGQNPPSYHAQIMDAGDNGYLTSSEYPVYNYLSYHPGGPRGMALEHRIYLLNAEDFYGSFRVFMRVKQVGGTAGDIGVQIIQMIYNTVTVIQTSDRQYTKCVGFEHLLEFGEFTFPGIMPCELNAGIELRFHLSNSAGAAADLYSFELILIPSDEFIFDVWTDGTSIYDIGVLDRRIEIDSIIDPKRLVRALTNEQATDDLISIWNAVASDKIPLYPDTLQRYWFLYSSVDTTSHDTTSWFYAGLRNQVQTTQRYLGRRGSG